MRKLLFVGDVCTPTGFARVNEHLLTGLKPTWDVHVLGINYAGDWHALQREYKLYPASMHGSDGLGIERFREVVEHVKPDLLVLHQDSWNIVAYLHQCEGLTLPPVLGYCPPDGPNQHCGAKLNTLDLLICPTQFGVDEVRKGGYTGEAVVLPYGVDRALYYPRDKRAARAALGLPQDALILGRADRNAPRKRYDLTLSIFAEWLRRHPERAATSFLHLHCSPRDQGWDLPQLVHYFGLQKQVFFTKEDLHPAVLLEEALLPTIYSAWDYHWSCTLGEGFGLVALESAACGVAQILPDYAAYGEWMQDGAALVRVGEVQVHTRGLNTVGGVVDREDCLDVLDGAWDGWRNQYWHPKALDVARRPAYDWATIVPRFAALVETTYQARLAAQKETVCG